MLRCPRNTSHYNGHITATRKILKVLQSNTFKIFLGLGFGAKRYKSRSFTKKDKLVDPLIINLDPMSKQTGKIQTGRIVNLKIL